MVQVLVRHRIADYKAWRAIFDASLDFRHEGGERSCRIFRNSEEGTDLLLLFEWETLEQAHRYMQSAELAAKMKQAGVVGKPEIVYLSEVYTVRRSAAD